MTNSKDISIIIQGPILEGITYKTVRNVRSMFPDSQIIVSTWEGSNYSDENADIIIENKDPGAPLIWENPPTYYNVNRQIVSTINGLRKSERKYAIKMRSDMYFKNINFLKFYNKFPKRSEKYNILKERVIISTSFSPNPVRGEAKPYHPSDWFFFGLTTDLIKIFSSELAPIPETTDYFKTHKRPVVRFDFWHKDNLRYATEQYIWVAFLRRFIELDFEHQFDIEKNNINI